MENLVADVLNDPNLPPEGDRLPLAQLAQVLQHVPLKERLSSCALVHSSWKAAAAEATTEIECSYNSNSLSAWMLSHCRQVHVTRMLIKNSRQTLGLKPLRIPVIDLQYLQKLELLDCPWESAPAMPESGSSKQPLQSSSGQQAARPGLASLTALTSLVLAGASVMLDGLEALTGLKELSISGRGEQRYCKFGIVPNFNIAEGLLAAALPKLQHLTRLSLGCEIGSSTALAQVSTLQRLEQLCLDETAVTSLPSMPQSLTQLRMAFCLLPPGKITGSTAKSFSQLTSLQELTLQDASELDTTLLEGMTRLRQVNLDVKQFAAASPEAQPLLVFSSLTALQRLYLSCCRTLTVTPAEAAALTTSSHLTYLRLDLGGTDGSLQEAHYEAMFPAGRQLQQLRELHVETALLSSTVDMGQLTGLTSLVLLHKRRMDVTESTVQLASGLKALTVLGDLAELQLSAENIELPAGVWRSLAALTGLTQLKVECEPPSGQHLLSLTSCQQLRCLDIPTSPIFSICPSKIKYAGGTFAKFVPGFNKKAGIQLQAPPGSPPDVWRQLPQEVLRVAQQQVVDLTLTLKTSDCRLPWADFDGSAENLHAAKQVQKAAKRCIRVIQRAQQLS